MRWCMDPEEPECNGPDCGHADRCLYYKEMMKDDPSAAKALAEYNRKKENAGAVGKGDGMKRRRAYVQSTTVCPVCGSIAVMRMFKCRCANWYGYHALRFYCKNKECPVDHVCTEFFPDREYAEKQMSKYMAKERKK